MSTCTLSQEYHIVATKDVDQVFLVFPITAVHRAASAAHKLRTMGYAVETQMRSTVKAVQTIHGRMTWSITR